MLVQVNIGRITPEEADARLAELKELCRTAGVRVLDVVTQRRQQVDPRYVIGKGKIEELVHARVAERRDRCSCSITI